MPDERRDRSLDPLLEPEDVNSEPQPEPATPDPNDEIPVPVAMFPSEVDERAQVVETLREQERRAGEQGEQSAEPEASRRET